MLYVENKLIDLLNMYISYTNKLFMTNISICGFRINGHIIIFMQSQKHHQETK